jgi:hypothetical protein
VDWFTLINFPTAGVLRAKTRWPPPEKINAFEQLCSHG